MIQVARTRYASFSPIRESSNIKGSVEFTSGDMLSPELGEFDYVVGMDSLIHYDAQDLINGVNLLSERTRKAILFTFPPRNVILALAHSIGQLFPRSNRSPSLAPVSQSKLRSAFEQTISTRGWREGNSARVSKGFYTSQAWEWVRQ